MADEQKENAKTSGGNESGKNFSSASSNSSNDEPQSGDPGRTPGSAEGDEATVDEDLREKEREGKL
jgi:hypothetical protein